MVVDSFLDAVEKFASSAGNGNPSAVAQHQLHHFSYIQIVTNMLHLHSIAQLIQCIQ